MRHCPNCGTKFTNHEAFCPYDGTPTVADAKENVDPWVGVVVDSRYRIESRIGEGGMGIVYRASHVLLNKRIAIKIVRADHAKDSEVAERFMQEARAATSIGHPNIIDINDFGRMPDGSVYFAMEFLNGHGLDELMEKGPLPMNVAIHIVEQITSALGAAHERGIVHRDLKPDNIFLIKHREDEHFVKVLDFGIAKVAGGSSRTTRTGMVFGTPHYMSPEQAAGQSVDHRTDVYALGVMMYEMFTGQLPFDAETFMGVLTMHMYDPPPLPSQISPEIAERIGELESVVLRALSKKPELRYQSMTSLRDDMKGVYNGARPSVDKAMLTGGATADTLPPPPEVGDFDAASFEQAAASLIHNTSGELTEPSGESARTDSGVPRASGTRRWAALAAVIAVVGVIALASRDDDKPSIETPALAAEPVSRVPKRPEPTPAVNEPTPAPTPTVSAAAPTKAIDVDSQPSGAEVFQDGALLGSTPLSLPRPSEGQVDLQIKLEGFRPALMRVMPSSPEHIVATLERAPTTKRPGGSKSSQKKPATTQPAQTKKAPSVGGMRDMVDPWNE